MQSYLASDFGVALSPILFTKSPLIVYASKDLIALVEAASLNLVATLAFWDAYPSTFGTETYVHHIAIDVAKKWIVAAAGTRVAVWSLSSLEESSWRVHSTLVTVKPVTALVCHEGRLAVGTPDALSFFTEQAIDELSTWSLKWIKRTPQPTQAAFSPSMNLLATRSSENYIASIWIAESGRLVQTISHPRPLISLSWRSPPSSKEEHILYTTTSDGALRIFLPVLDTPQHLQLHATIDPFSFLPSSLTTIPGSPVLPLSREGLRSVIGSVLRNCYDSDESQRRRLTELYEEGWDLFARILDDGSIVVQAVANIDRRPPTLLRQFNLLHSLFNPPLDHPPSALIVIPAGSQLILITYPPVSSHTLLPLLFFDAKRDGLRSACTIPESGKYGHLPISRIARSPEGHAVAIIRAGAAEIWRVKSSLRLLQQLETPKNTRVLVFHSGHSVAIYDMDEGSLTFRMEHSDPLTLKVPRLTKLFLIPPNHETITCLVGISADFQIFQIHAKHPPNPSLTIHSTTSLPDHVIPSLIVPVDPMVWNRTASELIVSISKEGDLDFWAEESSHGWKATGRVRTGKKNIYRARCSSAKKTVLVARQEDGGDEVSIWDSKESQFSSGLEYCEAFSPETPVVDLDWTATPDGQSILAIGFPHYILLLYQQRMTYFEQEPPWGVFGKLEIGQIAKYPIVDSIWISGGQILTGAGHQMIQARPGVSLRGNAPAKDLFETVAQRNGPLPDYHPQMLLQCLLWEKVSAVKQIIVRLAQGLKYLTPEERAEFELPSLPVDTFLESEESFGANPVLNKLKGAIGLFDGLQNGPEEENGGFSQVLVTRLIRNLEEMPLQTLSENENEQLLVLLQTTLDIDEHRRALDADGLRYLISIRVFYLLNKRILSSTGMRSPISGNVSEKRRGLRERIRYRDIVWAFHSECQEVLLTASSDACGNKMVWSDARALGVFLWLNSTEAIRNQMETIARNQYMSGEERDPTACCLFYFALGKVRLVQGLWRQASWHPEQAIMLRFLSNDFEQPRWRTAALKNAFALLGKRRFEMAAAFFLLGGSLKDAVNVCLKQLGDFQMAVALARVVEGEKGPILAEILKSTVIPMAFREGNRWLGSWAFWKLNRRDLGVRILVTPLKEYAIMLESEDFSIPETTDSNYDDPSLALLFSRLKSVSLQTIKGTSMIPGQQEFDFVLQIAKVFCRMGCHVLALDLVTSWSFDPPELSQDWAFSFRSRSSRSTSPMPSSPSLRRSKSRKRSIIDIDLNVQSPSHDAPTPKLASHGLLPPVPESNELQIPTPSTEESTARGRSGLGRLMQTAKRDVEVPEFDMGAFF